MESLGIDRRVFSFVPETSGIVIRTKVVFSGGILHLYIAHIAL